MRGERLQGWAIAVAAIVVLGAGGFALTSDWTGLAVFALAFASIQAVVFVGFFRAYGDALVARGRPRCTH